MGTSMIIEPWSKICTFLDYLLHVNKCIIFCEGHVIFRSYKVGTLCHCSALTMSSQILHLDFAHGPRNASLFLTGATLTLIRIPFKRFALWNQ